MKGISRALVLGIAVAMASTTAFALDDDRQVGSKITLKNTDFGVYEGELRSKSRKCIQDRKVVVVHDKDRTGFDDSDFVIGKTKSGREGTYTVVGPQPPTGDRIAVKAGNKEQGGGKPDCRAAYDSAVAGGF